METKTLAIPFRADSPNAGQNERIASLFGKKLFALKAIADIHRLARLVAQAKDRKIATDEFLHVIPYSYALETFEYDLIIYSEYNERSGEDRSFSLHTSTERAPQGWEAGDYIAFAIPLDKFDVLLANEMPQGKDRRSRALYAIAKEVCEAYLRECSDGSYAYVRIYELLHA